MCLLLINLASAHPIQAKTNLSSATSKHCCVMGLQPWLREMFQWLRAEGAEACSVSYGDLGQATVLEVSVNLK